MNGYDSEGEGGGTEFGTTSMKNRKTMNTRRKELISQEKKKNYRFFFILKIFCISSTEFIWNASASCKNGNIFNLLFKIENPGIFWFSKAPKKFHIRESFIYFNKQVIK